ncbi:DUF6602 domain-containing protein [Microbacterium maritypicum]|uniref:DUF6602 domain-containing protein n=1 Tax=Microbacterium maritypicum TaxID=33918 RepID=UPI0038120E92
MTDSERDEPKRVSLPQRIIEAHAAEAIERMRTAALVTHPGERGTAREEILRQYLVEIVPRGFDVATGFVIDCHGAQSRQQDLIVVRRDYHPRFQVGGAHFFPVEAVAAVIEVKSSLTRSTLKHAVENARSVKSLDRSGGGRNYIVNGGIGGSRGEAVRSNDDAHQIMSLIVGADSTIGGIAAYEAFTESIANLPRRVWPNCVAAASHWYLSYHVTGGEPRTDAQNASGIRIHKVDDVPNVDPLVDVAHDLWSWLRVVPLIDAWPNNYVTPSTMAYPCPLPGSAPV